MTWPPASRFITFSAVPGLAVPGRMIPGNTGPWPPPLPGQTLTAQAGPPQTAWRMLPAGQRQS
jgi:hypothetical protein